MVGTARCAVRAALGGATIPSGVSRARTSQRDVPAKNKLKEDMRIMIFL